MSAFISSPLNTPAATAYDTTVRNTEPAPRGEGNTVIRGEDQVELSNAARILSGQDQPAEIRSDLVARIRDEIAAGTYETPDKFDAVVSRLARDLG